jgi:acetyl-CoA carboxylase carboxyltransferase component
MTILDTALDPRASSFLDNRSKALAALTALEAAHGRAREGGGEREVTRHHARGKLLPRERIELLVDRDTALLELAATAGIPAGGGLVTAIGVIEQQECMIIGNDPTVREVGLTDAGRFKAERAVEVARQYRLPVVLLWESMVEANEVVAHGCSPIISAIFGASDAPQQLTDHSVIIRGHGLPSHADSVAEDERDAIRLVRVAVRRLCRSHRAPTGGGAPPRHEADDLLAVHRTDLPEVLARVLDGSEFDELRPHRGSAIIAGFGAVHGHRTAVLGNCAPDVDPESLYKAIELTRQAEMAGLPVVVLASTGDGDEPLLSRALSSGYQISILLDENPPAWALASKGLRFSWPTPDWQIHDGVIDPRDTRTVLGICLSAMGERS